MDECGSKAASDDIRTLFDSGALGRLPDGELLAAFVERGEEKAFELLVLRHGPMVRGVCRRILRDHHDAEDAFQATFLVLARRAGSVRPREHVANWLYGVAYRTALRARADALRRRAREWRDGTPEPHAPAPSPDRDERAERLDRELERLPDKYRLPIVLCELGGRSHREAAELLGWPIGTVSGRLSRAKVLLRQRISRRGGLPPVGIFPTSQVLPTGMAAAVARTVVSGRVSPRAAILAGSLSTMIRWQGIAATLASALVGGMVGAGAVGLVVLGRAALPPSPPKAETKEVARPTALEAEQSSLQGVWTGAIAEADGRRLHNQPPNAPTIDSLEVAVNIRGTVLTARGDMLERLFTGADATGKAFDLALKLDPAQKPKAVDLSLRMARTDGGPTTYPGIYKQVGDQLVICFDLAGKKRPRRFRTEPESSEILLRLELDEGFEWRDEAAP